MRKNKLKQMFKNGEPIINGWLQIPSAFSAEVMAHQGWDSCTIDMQHGVVDYPNALGMLQALSTTDVTPLARVNWNEPGQIMKILDAGCYGVICPMVSNRKEAENFVQACLYPSKGYRSFGPIRGLLYGGSDYAKHADTPMDAAKDCDFIFTCVGNDNDLREVTLGEKGLFKTAKKGSIYVDNTTASANIARELYKEAKAKGFDFLDAPISGGQAGAEGGILTVMVGGDETPFKKAEPVIDCYSKKIKLLGPSGSGQLTKMVNQICIAGLVQGLSEAINFGMNAGLNMHDVIEVISKGAAQSWQMENRHKTMIEDKFDYGFAVDWMRKDLKIAMDEAKKNNSPLPITKIIDEYYGEVQKMGGQRWDTSSLIKRFRK